MKFMDWIKTEDGQRALDATDASKGKCADALSMAWDAALDAAAREMRPMLRDMISRGHAVDAIRSLRFVPWVRKVAGALKAAEGHQQGDGFK